MNKSDYKPIPCETYSQYELAILHHERLRTRWRDRDGVEHVEALVPRDLVTRAGEEFLIARTLDGEPRELRLDRIRHTDVL